jgi:hypothetical protein
MLRITKCCALCSWSSVLENTMFPKLGHFLSSVEIVGVKFIKKKLHNSRNYAGNCKLLMTLVTLIIHSSESCWIYDNILLPHQENCHYIYIYL